MQASNQALGLGRGRPVFQKQQDRGSDLYGCRSQKTKTKTSEKETEGEEKKKRKKKKKEEEEKEVEKEGVEEEEERRRRRRKRRNEKRSALVQRKTPFAAVELCVANN